MRTTFTVILQGQGHVSRVAMGMGSNADGDMW